MPLALLEIAPPFATLTLNRPDARNALSIAMLTDLRAAAEELAERADVTVLTVTGAGKSFCAGMDLKAVLEPLPEGGAGVGLKRTAAFHLLSGLAEFTLALRALPMVTLARVNGAAIGGGCGLACVCDFSITHADSKMGFPEVDLGVCPAVVAPWLVRRVGPGKARQILLQGGLMSGQRAFEIGMVTHAVPGISDLDTATDELARKIAAGGANALRATKALLNQIDGSDDDALVRRGAEISAQVLSTPEAQERLHARLGG